MAKIRLARDLQTDSIVDGKGLRCVLWTQGCPHGCIGCHNPLTHSFTAGMLVDTTEVISNMKRYNYHDGITLSGGEPFMQPLQLLEIAEEAKNLNWNIWCYTGFEYEELLENSDRRELLEMIDVLIDGKFELDKRTLSLPFRGSTNQRVIDVQESLKENKVIKLEL